MIDIVGSDRLEIDKSACFARLAESNAMESLKIHRYQKRNIHGFITAQLELGVGVEVDSWPTQ